MRSFLYDFWGYNESMFICINNITNTNIVPDILEAISLFFSIEKFAIYYFITCLYAYFKLRKTHISEAKFFPIYNEMVKAGTCYALFGFAYAAFKFGINMPRPFCSLTPEQFTTIIDTTKERCLSSFPSAHVGLSVIIAYYLWQYFKEYQKVIMSLLIISVAVSRMTLAMHYPADILYSIIIVFIIIYLSNKLVNYLQNKVVIPIGSFILRWLF